MKEYLIDPVMNKKNKSSALTLITKLLTKQNVHTVGEPLPMRIIRKMYPLLEKSFPKTAHKLGYKLFFTPLKFKTPPRELPILEKSKRFQQEINDKNTHFYSWGNEANPLVLLVHGWMGRASQFYKIIDSLLERQYFVVAFDGPAHGASSGKQTSVVDFAEAIATVEEKFKPIHFAVGHSFGGITLLHAIKKGVKIDHIAFIATPSISEDIVKQFEGRINASPATGEYFQKRVLKKYGVSFKSISASEAIKEVDLKSLYLVHDDQDKDVGIEHAHLMQERFPAAKTLYTSGLGHTRILRDEGVAKQLIDRIDQFR
jgi:pimeloyl-ACP methyl ester carboxylesterase